MINCIDEFLSKVKHGEFSNISLSEDDEFLILGEGVRDDYITGDSNSYITELNIVNYNYTKNPEDIVLVVEHRKRRKIRRGLYSTKDKNTHMGVLKLFKDLNERKLI